MLEPESDSPFRKGSLGIETKNCMTSFLLKQSLFNALEENDYKPDKTNDNILVWVQRHFTRYRKALKEGNLPLVLLPNVNHLHTFQPDDGLEIIRYVLVQVFLS